MIEPKKTELKGDWRNIAYDNMYAFVLCPICLGSLYQEGSTGPGKELFV
jgi:hypothetical protein